MIRLHHFVRVPYRSRVPLSRRAVFARDGHRCQYCNRAAENIDHVRAPLAGRSARVGQRGRLVPVVQLPQGGPPPLRGRPHASRHPPREPTPSLWVVATAGSIDPAWEPFLPAAASSLAAPLPAHRLTSDAIAMPSRLTVHSADAGVSGAPSGAVASGAAGRKRGAMWVEWWGRGV